jgi:multiple sugar transport system permease protein
MNPSIGRKTAALGLLIVATGVFMFPFLWSLSISFQPPGDVFRWPIKLIPDPATLRNYERLWTEIPFARWLFNGSSTVVIH